MGAYMQCMYRLFAKRNGEVWTDWSQTNAPEQASEHFDKIKSLGFGAKFIDRQMQFVMIFVPKKDNRHFNA